MPRPGRMFVEGGIYHVYNRISRGDMVFSDEKEAEEFRRSLAKMKQRDGLVVFAWCLMSNHYHLALRSGAVPIHRSMKSIQQSVTRSFNARHRVFGPLWQGRYRAKLVEDQTYLDGLLAYIHLNPVSAGLVDDPVDYRWSGHREILGRTKEPIVDVDEVLVLFGGTRRTARRRYVRAVRMIEGESWAGEGPGHLPWWKLGRPSQNDDQSPNPDYTVTVVDELGRSTGLEREAYSFGDFVGKSSVLLKVGLGDLMSRSRSVEVVRARELIATLGVERYGMQVKALAEALNKSSEAVSRMVTRGIENRQEDREFSSEFEELDRWMAGESGIHTETS